MHGFRISFTPLTGVLFIVRSRYWFAIGRQVVFSLASWSTQIRAGYHVTRSTWETTRRDTRVFAYGALTLCGRTFQSGSANVVLSDSSVPPQRHSVAPATPVGQRLRAITPGRFGLFPVRSPLLGKSLLLSFPRGTEMFHSPRSASAGYELTRRRWSMTPSGLSHSEIHGSKLVRQLPVAYRSLTASFIASWRQNIHHAPFVAWPPIFLSDARFHSRRRCWSATGIWF